MDTLTEFRKPHKIEPVPVYLFGQSGPDHYACDVDGIEVYRLRNHSWRHVVAPTREMVRPATWPGRTA